MHRPNKPQGGMASVVVVSILTVVITLIVIGFARIMNRTITSSANRQQSTAANYAAQSALNDLATYIKANPDTASNKCSGVGSLIGTSDEKGPFYNDAQLGNNTQYTCLLVNPIPTDLEQDPIDPGSSWVIKATTQYPSDRMLLSWESADGGKLYPPLPTSKLYDTNAWRSGKYQSLIRVTLYPIPTSNNIKDTQAQSKTVFLYPQAQSGPVPQIDYGAIADGTVLPVACTQTIGSGTFNGSARFACNLIIRNLQADIPQFGYMYIRAMSVYDRARLDIMMNDVAKNQMQFIKTQAVVDATAVSGTVAKRLQGRVDISDNGSGASQNVDPSKAQIPEYGVRSANTLCKRLTTSSLNYVSIDGSFDSPLCNLTLTPPPKQDVVTTNADNITTGSATVHGTVTLNGSNVTNCYFKYGIDTDYSGGQVACASLPTASSPDVLANLSGLSAGTTYHYQLYASSTYFPDVPGGDKTFTTPNPPPPPPPPPPTCDPNTDPSCGGAVPPCDPNTDPSCVPDNPDGCVPGDPRPQCKKPTDFLNIGIYKATSNTNPPASNICGDTEHTYVVCVYWTWFYGTPTTSIACYVYWEPDGHPAQLKSGNLFINERPSGAAEGFTMGESNVAVLQSLTGWVMVACQSNEDPSTGVQRAYYRVDFTGICGYNVVTGCPDAPLPPPPPPIGPLPPPIDPPPISRVCFDRYGNQGVQWSFDGGKTWGLCMI